MIMKHVGHNDCTLNGSNLQFLVGKKHPSKIVQTMLLKVNEVFNVIAQWQSEFTGIIYTDTGTICQKFWPLMH